VTKLKPDCKVDLLVFSLELTHHCACVYVLFGSRAENREVADRFNTMV